MCKSESPLELPLHFRRPPPLHPIPSPASMLHSMAANKSAWFILCQVSLLASTDSVIAPRPMWTPPWGLKDSGIAPCLSANHGPVRSVGTR